MIDPDLILDNPDFVRMALYLRYYPEHLVDDFLEANRIKKELTTKEQELFTERNRITSEISKSRGDFGLIEKAKLIKKQIAEMGESVKKATEEERQILLQIPNIPRIGNGSFEDMFMAFWKANIERHKEESQDRIDRLNEEFCEVEKHNAELEKEYKELEKQIYGTIS